MYEIKLHRRPDSGTVRSIVGIAELLTSEWFTANVPADIEKDLLFHDALCLYDGDVMRAFIVFTSLDGSINITLMGTHPEYRNKGLGSILMNRLFAHAKEIGFDRVTAFTVPPDKKPAYMTTVQFYQKHGFTISKIYSELWESGAMKLVKKL